MIASNLKRLRLRGDWSDTGPNARPEGITPTNPSNNNEEGGASPMSVESAQEPTSVRRFELHQTIKLLGGIFIET